MNIRLLLTALRARYRLFLLILFTTVATTAAITLLLPKSYVATASLLMDGRDEQSMRSTSAPPERERAGYMQTQVDIISSPKVARRVIADLKLTENAEIREAFARRASAGTIEDWLADGLTREIKVDTSQSSIIQLAFASPDAQYSARVANAYAKAYVDTVLELRVEPTRQTSLWFDDQLKGLRDNMAQAERRLTEFQQAHGIVASDERYDLEHIQLTDLAGEAARSRDGAGEMRGNGSTRDSLPEIVANPGIQTLKTDLLRAEARLQQISTELGSRHPQYLRQQAEVNGLRQRVNSEIGMVVASAEVAAQRSRQRKERLLGEIAAQRDRVLGLKQARNQLAMLTHDVEIAQRTYDTAMQRFMASKIESRALQTNVSVLDPAVAPSRPARPRVALNIALSVIVGTLLAFAAVHLQEMFEQRVRLIDDLDAYPKVPLLAVLHRDDPAPGRLLGGPAPRHALPAPG
ncbi:MAG TPA: chain length determinant protein EpsF [Azospira sp.]|nr:chain length determinant protein EpsF [Azospira sp.]